MNYYMIAFLVAHEDTGIYQHLPCNYQVTNDLQVAEGWFKQAVDQAGKYGNKLISVKDMPLDYMCTIKEAVFECGEPGYRKGRYLINLRCYSHNPLI